MVIPASKTQDSPIFVSILTIPEWVSPQGDMVPSSVTLSPTAMEVPVLEIGVIVDALFSAEIPVRGSSDNTAMKIIDPSTFLEFLIP